MALPVLDDYLSLITTMYRGKLRFVGLCSALVQPLVDQQALLAAIRDGFDLDTAVGAQLDQVGAWVGCSRLLKTPLTDVYFAWGAPGLGWAQGSWKGPHDPSTGMVSLPDDVYRTLIRATIAANSWDGTIPKAYEIWSSLFSGTGLIIVIQDNQDMSMVVGVAGTYLDAVTKSLLTGGYIPLKPAGVRVSYVVAPQGGPLFAWGCDSDALAGWGFGSWGEHISPTT